MSRLHEVRAQARPVFERHHPEHLAALPLILLPVIEVDATALDRDVLPVGSSKLGGLPDLRGDSWPGSEGEPLFFVAQFNLAELAPYDEDGLLPPEGLLSFFLGRRAIEHAEMSPEHWAVRYESDLNGLRRAASLGPGSLQGEYATPPHRVTFQAGVHPYGSVEVRQPDGSFLSLPYDQLIFDPAWQAVGDDAEPSGDVYLLGSALATGVQPIEEQEGEVVLLALPSTSGLPFVDFGNGVAFAFLIGREALQAADFSRVRLAFTMT